ncbi:MAG: sugar ABC transporter permease [Bacillota bacterium]
MAPRATPATAASASRHRYVRPLRKRRIPRTRVRRWVTAYVFLVPALVLMAVFTFYPIIMGMVIMFYDYTVFEPMKFVGLANFSRAFADRDFQKSVLHSVEYIIVVPILQLLSIFVAVLVNRNRPGITFFRTAYYIPVVTSSVAVAISWKWLYNSEGILNYALMSVGVTGRPLHWLTSKELALPSVMMVTMWKGIGWYMVIYLAGLQSVPKELEEAAAIDGASRWQVVRHVTIPLLRPYVLFASFMSVMGALQVFDEVFVMTGGGPLKSTLTMAVYQYHKAFGAFDFGYAAAMGMLMALMILVFNVPLFRTLAKGGLKYY